MGVGSYKRMGEPGSKTLALAPIEHLYHDPSQQWRLLLLLCSVKIGELGMIGSVPSSLSPIEPHSLPIAAKTHRPVQIRAVEVLLSDHSDPGILHCA